MNSSSILKLINYIKENPCLYDYNHAQYKNVYKKNLLWDKIAEELGMTAEQVRQRWKTIRDTHTRSKKFKNKKYIWGHHIKFLDAVPKRASRHEVQMIEVKRERGTDSNDDQYFSDGGNEPATEVIEEPVDMPVAMEYLETDMDKGVEHLFMSYAETFRKFPRRTQINLKLELAKLFANAELQQLDGIEEAGKCCV